MTNPSSNPTASSPNLSALDTKSRPSQERHPLTMWGGPLAIGIFTIALDLIVWMNDGVFDLTTQPKKITFMLWSVLVAFALSMGYVAMIFLGGHRAIRRIFTRLNGEAGAEQEASKRTCDARLEELCMVLRRQIGWRWRYRMPWLLVCGDNATVEQVAPGLKQAGIQCFDEVVLIHPAPDGIAPEAWLKQIRKLRRRRPIDVVVQLGDDNAATPDTASDAAALRRLSEDQRELGWAAPVVFLYPVPMDAWLRRGHDERVGVFVDAPRRRSPEPLHGLLGTVEASSAQVGVMNIQHEKAPFMAALSAYIGAQRASIASRWAAWHASHWRQAPLAGVMFAPLVTASTIAAPVPVADAAGDVARIATEASRSRPVPMNPGALRPTWHEIVQQAKRHRGKRIGVCPRTAVTVAALACLLVWTAGMTVSGLRNRQDVATALDAMQAIKGATSPDKELRALLALQQQIQRYEYRVQHHAPFFTRFGLNRDDAVLAALWKPYAKASHDILVTPVAQDLEATLIDLSQLQTANLDDKAAKWALEGRNTLKTYLMLAHPERVDPAFLAQQLVQHWSTDARITPGQKQDLAERFARFYAEHLKANPDWRIEPRTDLVGGARQTLLAVIGERNAVDTIYQNILEGVGNKYPDQTLASLTAGTDPRGLVRATAIVPGVFTRQAYEGYVEAAIEKAAKRRDVANDWVLTDGQPQQAQAGSSASAPELRQALTERYFADYSEHWQAFMNGTQWEPAATIPGVTDQLKLMADARQSPVIALMKALAYQGGAGARKDSLSDTLMAKAQGILGKKDDTPEATQPDPAGPLAASFGPVLRLVSQTGQGSAGNSDLSLQRYLDRITAVRLRLQQMTNSADADTQARQIAQALFQGKGSDLADTQAYGRLMAASLGAEWAGMGEALFVRPIAQATQAVLLPAQASLNEAWRQSIALPWNRAFAGRYPFTNSANDASFAEVARYIRPQSGLINAFLLAELGGVLALQGDQWVPVGSGAQALNFDPDFLKFINTLQRLAAHMLVQGEPQYRFEIKPIPTPGLTDTLLTVDNQKLHYYNQRETWQAMTWPANNLQEPRTLLQWQTEAAGTNKNYEFGGRWGLLRMLERARIVPLDSATFQLTWQAVPDSTVARVARRQDEPETREPSPPESPESLTARDAREPAPQHMTYPIQYLMRAEVGRGPLEALEFRNLATPERMFLPPNAGAAPVRTH